MKRPERHIEMTEVSPIFGTPPMMEESPRSPSPRSPRASPRNLDGITKKISLDGMDDIPAPPEQNFQKLTFFPLMAILFYMVSGGPYGMEACVRAGGNFYAIMGFIIAPLIWSLPEALMTAELGTAIPEASAGVAWVEEAFGNQAGWIFGYLGWISGATDNAIYPVLFLDYLIEALYPKGDDEDEGALGSHTIRVMLITITSIMLAYVNWRGLEIVGHLSVGICILSMSPFVILCLIGMWKVDPSRWFIMPEPLNAAGMRDDDDSIGAGILSNPAFAGVLWRPFLNNLFWNLNSFDAAAAFAEDIHEPSVLLPKALKWSVVLVALGYILPLLVAIGASTATQHDWVDGYLDQIVREVGGKWLAAWTILAAGVSNIALFQSELSADALQLMGMADRGFLPKCFTKRGKYGTPTAGIALCTAVVIVMGASKNLDSLIEMLNFNYGLSLLMEYSAFIKLRVSRPDMERPYRIPLSTFGCIIFFLPPAAITIFILALASYATLLVSLAINVVFLSIFYGKQYGLHHRLASCGQRYEKVDTTMITSSGTSSTGSCSPGYEDDDLRLQEELPDIS
jgi:amino acid transporter